MTSDNIPIRVLHFDHAVDHSANIRKKLAEEFKQYPIVQYLDYRTLDRYGSFATHEEALERLYEETDVFLVHPGTIYAVRKVAEYPERFPHMKVAFVIAGDASSEKPDSIRCFGYQSALSIVDFVLEQQHIKEVAHFFRGRFDALDKLNLVGAR